MPLPAIHTCRPAYPAVRQCLAARRLGSPWHTSGSGRGGSDPPVRGLGTGSGAGVFSHPCPRPLGVAPEPAIRAGRQFNASSRRGSTRSPAAGSPDRRGFARRGQRRCLRAGASPNRAPPHRETTRKMVTQNSSIGKLRSSFRDWAAEEPDHPRVIVEAALAHAVPSKVEAAYRPTDLVERRRQLMDEWMEHLAGREPTRGLIGHVADCDGARRPFPGAPEAVRVICGPQDRLRATISGFRGVRVGGKSVRRQGAPPSPRSDGSPVAPAGDPATAVPGGAR